MTKRDILAESLGPPLPPHSESMTLLEQAKGGDESALNQLLERYQERLRRIVRARMGQGIGAYLESMDIVQDTYQVAWRKLATIEVRGPGSIINWLARVAERQILNAVAHGNAGKRDRRLEVGMDASPECSGLGIRDTLESDSTRPPEAAEYAELSLIIDQALAKLPDEQKECILLRDYCGGDWEEVASALERSVGAAQQLHLRARIKLANKLGPGLDPCK